MKKYLLVILISLAATRVVQAQNINWHLGINGQSSLEVQTAPNIFYSTELLNPLNTIKGAGILGMVEIPVGRHYVNYQIGLRYGTIIPGYRGPYNRFYPGINPFDRDSWIALPPRKEGILIDQFITFFPERFKIWRKTTNIGFGVSVLSVNPNHKWDYIIHDHNTKYIFRRGFSYITPGLLVDVVKKFNFPISLGLKLTFHPHGFVQYYPQSTMLSGNFSINYWINN